MTQDHTKPVEHSEDGETITVVFGRQLTAARVAAEQSVATMAQELCITTSAIELLESGHWESAGPDVYVRGYVIAYCRRLDLDAAEAMLYFKQRKSERVASDSLDALSRQRRPKVAQYQRVVGYAAATLLIGPALIFWVAQGFRGGDPIGTVSQEQLFQGSAPIVQELQAQVSIVSQLAVEQPVMASMATVPETMGQTAAPGRGPDLLQGQTTDSGAGIDSTADQGAGLLELEFQQDVWLEVSDSDGKRLDYGLISANSKRSFPIAHGLSVRLGNADSVVAKVDGEVLDLRPYINQDVASFSLPVVETDNGNSSVD